MGRKAIRILFQEDPIETGREYPVVFEFRIRDRIELLDVSGVFEGICRCTVDSQDTAQSLLNVLLDLSQLFANQVQSKGKLVLPSGVYRVPGVINISRDTPGSFKGKWGAIAYRFRVQMKARRHGEEATLDNEKNIDVIGSVAMGTFPNFEKPVSLSRVVKKKFLCFNKLDAKVKIDMEKAAFMPGEFILLTGEIENAESSHNLKGIFLELRQKIQYKSGDGKRTESRLISKINCGSCTSGDTMKLHHSVQVPLDLYPTLAIPNSAIQIFYEILISCSGYFQIDIPVFIGNRNPHLQKALDNASVGSRNSWRTVGSNSSFEKGSYKSNSSDPYYYVPMSDFSDRPPPYMPPGFQGRAYFVPIHMQQQNAFRPNYGLPQMPAFHQFPPRYHEMHSYGPRSPPSPRERFLKIEEIE